MLRNSIFILVAASILSCSSDDNSNNGEFVSAVAAGESTDAELKKEIARIEKEELQRIADEKANVTSMTFDKLRHDFGEIYTDTDNTTEFTVTNTGDKPLIIDDVKASCGCTTPQKPEKPILPGQSDVIKVSFHPNPDQKNEIVKAVTVTANTEPRITTLEIRSFVK
jgi:hypothetical protein